MIKAVVYTLNTIIILAASIGLGFLSAGFYLGAKEDHQILMEHLSINFTIRLGFFAFIGLVFTIAVLGGNSIVNRTFLKNDPLPVFKVWYMACIALLIGCITGCLFFFEIVR